VDCGGQAAEWSYSNSGVEEKVGDLGGYEVRYSADLSQYEARCVACHRAFDAIVARERRSA
jgi:hypothetical protein